MELTIVNIAGAFAGYNRKVVFSNEVEEGVLWLQFDCYLDGADDKERRISVDLSELCKIVKAVKDLGTEGSAKLLFDSGNTYRNDSRVTVHHEDYEGVAVFVLNVDGDCRLYFEEEKLLTVLNVFE